MNPIHREAAGSARLHLFQELSTLGQQLAIAGISVRERIEERK
jgi:hypothetical protein